MNVAIFVKGLAVLSWLVFIGALLLTVTRVSRRQNVGVIGTATLAAIVMAIIFSSLGAGLVFINPEERGVVISALDDKGYRTDALQPGLRWITPFFENVIIYRISRQTYTMSVVTGEGQVTGDDSVAARTADGQQINFDASVIYAIDPDKVTQVHIQWQSRYADELVRPLSRGIIRDVVSQYGVEEVVTSKRDEMAAAILESMRTKLAENGLTLVDFVLRNITFSAEYANSVEQKQISEQQAQQAKFIVEQKRQEAEQARQTAQGQADAAVIASKGAAEARLIQAQAEAQALEVIAKALNNNPDLLTYQYINKIAPGVQVMLVPNNSPYLLPLPTLQTTPVPTATP